MGDIADWHVEQIIDGSMPWWGHSRRSTPPTCRRCGVLCTWGQRRGKWILMEGGREHACTDENRLKQAASGFESIE